ncbi:hypothetical protein VNO77_44580 [Canavalia gladiata]|uniref:Uncharacterized protein n=1 Tax=Canavalia gladiata TaxID=3824 RepID=A0AAN9JYD1_CANGL
MADPLEQRRQVEQRRERARKELPVFLYWCHCTVRARFLAEKGAATAMKTKHALLWQIYRSDYPWAQSHFYPRPKSLLSHSGLHSPRVVAINMLKSQVLYNVSSPIPKEQFLGCPHNLYFTLSQEPHNSLSY